MRMPVGLRVRRVGRASLLGSHRGPSGERQNDEERDEQRMHVHYAAIGSIRLGSLFLTLPTRGLTGQPSFRRRVGGSFDDLVGLGEEQRRHGEAERFGRLKIDHQLECRRLLDRQIGGPEHRQDRSERLYPRRQG
jgi:PAS domain-containing protein